MLPPSVYLRDTPVCVADAADRCYQCHLMPILCEAIRCLDNKLSLLYKICCTRRVA